MAPAAPKLNGGTKKGKGVAKGRPRQKVNLTDRDCTTIDFAFRAVFSLATGLGKSPSAYFAGFIEEGEEKGLIVPGALVLGDLGLPVWNPEAAEAHAAMVVAGPDVERAAQDLVEAAAQVAAPDDDQLAAPADGEVAATADGQLAAPADGQLATHEPGITKTIEENSQLAAHEPGVTKTIEEDSQLATHEPGVTKTTEKDSQLLVQKAANTKTPKKDKKRKRESGEHANGPAKKKQKKNEKGPMIDTLSDHTYMNAYLHRELRKAITEVKLEPHASWFRQPVVVGWPDIADAYAQAIQRPSDLGTIEQKLASRKYKTLGQFRKEVDLIAVNAAIWNGPESVIATHAAMAVQDVQFRVRVIPATDPDACI